MNSNRPDLDEFVKKMQDGGWKITGGKYAPKPMNSKLREQLLRLMRYSNTLTPYKLGEPLDPFVDGALSDTEKAIRQAVGEELRELLPTDENVTTKYGYHRDEKKYGYRMAIVDIKEVIKQWQGGEDV